MPQLHMNLTATEKTKLLGLAKQHDVTLSQLVRGILADAVPTRMTAVRGTIRRSAEKAAKSKVKPLAKTELAPKKKIGRPRKAT